MTHCGGNDWSAPCTIVVCHFIGGNETKLGRWETERQWWWAEWLASSGSTKSLAVLVFAMEKLLEKWEKLFQKFQQQKR